MRGAYGVCRRMHKRHGRTYYLATLLLPAGKRPHIHALYGFARLADDIVDEPGPGGAAESAQRLAALRRRTEEVLSGQPTTHPVLAAVANTVRRFAIDPAHVTAFLDSMRMDLSITGYGSYEELRSYMHGSAAVIGLMTLPVLGHTVPYEVAAPYAADLGVAFQLTNFIRDVGEDARRGRVYLPADEMAAFGVTAPSDGPAMRELLAFQIARARRIYRAAYPGIRLLAPASRDCVRTAFQLYREILDEVERADYRVLDRRVAVSKPRRLAVAAAGLGRAILSR